MATSNTTLPGTLPGLLGEVGVPVLVTGGEYAGLRGIVTELTTGDVGPVVALTGGPRLPLACEVIALDLEVPQGFRRATRWLQEQVGERHWSAVEHPAFQELVGILLEQQDSKDFDPAQALASYRQALAVAPERVREAFQRTCLVAAELSVTPKPNPVKEIHMDPKFEFKLADAEMSDEKDEYEPQTYRVVREGQPWVTWQVDEGPEDRYTLIDGPGWLSDVDISVKCCGNLKSDEIWSISEFIPNYSAYLILHRPRRGVHWTATLDSLTGLLLAASVNPEGIRWQEHEAGWLSAITNALEDAALDGWVVLDQFSRGPYPTAVVE